MRITPRRRFTSNFKWWTIRGNSKLNWNPKQRLFLRDWTTTPWTLPANLAIAVHPGFTYQLVQTPHGQPMINRELIGRVTSAIGLEPKDYSVLERAWSGAQLEGIVCRHPWLQRDSRVILGVRHPRPGYRSRSYCARTWPGRL